MTNTCKISLVLTLLLTLLFLSNGCDRSSPTEIQKSAEYALSFVELGTVQGSRIHLSYTNELSSLADKAFEIGIYDQASTIETISMKNGDTYQQDLKPGTYKVKVENPANHSFLYLPGEEFELKTGIGQIYAMVVNSINSIKTSQPVAWEIYYTEIGSPAGEKPLARGEVPALKPGELFTITYNTEDNPNRKAGNYMFKLINPGNGSQTKECWSGAIYCMGPIKPAEVTVSLVDDPGKLVVSKYATGHAPATPTGTLNISKIVEGRPMGDTLYEISIKGAGLSINRSITADQTISLDLVPGTYEVTEINTGEALRVRQIPEGKITIKPNQTINVKITNIYPNEIPVQ